MKYGKYRKICHFTRDKIFLSIANKLIGVGVEGRVGMTAPDGTRYEARYHRLGYFADGRPITIRGILKRRKTYYVDYWDGGTKGKVWCEMFGWGEKFIYVKRGEKIETLALDQLNHVTEMWRKYVSHKGD